jgi:hypothetical protein
MEVLENSHSCKVHLKSLEESTEKTNFPTQFKR